MRIAICHYHLQRGGVTRIIHNTVRALKQLGNSVVVLAGEGPPESWQMPCGIIPELHYDTPERRCSADILFDKLTEAARNALGKLPDIWHFHNHSLGKNLALPLVIQKLAHQGHRLLLHIHDFPEDGRPDNYRRLLENLAEGNHEKLSSLLYPTAPHVHYALLNSRDLNFMRDAGASTETLHLLPNPVEIHSSQGCIASKVHSHDMGKRLYLYPTRAIRRKNIGEFLFWASHPEHRDDMFALTMAPSNPLEKPFYNRWKALSEGLGLPVQFEYSQKTGCSFGEMVASSHAIMTTSIAEGFGMAFLEPWLMGRAVCGRDLPEITSDFTSNGITLPYMYKELAVPVSIPGENRIRKRIDQVLRNYTRAYSIETDKLKPGLSSIADAWIEDGLIDFARLDEELQADIIKRCAEDPGLFSEIECSHPPARIIPDENTIISNCSRIKEVFSIEDYGSAASEIYRDIAMKEPGQVHYLDGKRLLSDFMSPERLSMLRMGTWA